MRFYGTLMDDTPYESLTMAMLEHELPGGHSPAYFAIINNAAPFSKLYWGNDPAAFAGVPEYFLAHEIAHQWWGQAVGWKNYHEQWLSEGFAQYFAALYAQRAHGDASFDAMLRQFRRWSLSESEEGPIDLGYRLGLHSTGEGRDFSRARLQQRRRGAAHAAAPASETRPSSTGCAVSTRSRSSRRREPTTSSGRWKRHRDGR